MSAQARTTVMTTSRIELFEQMLASDPDNTLVMFGLAKEYEKLGRYADVVALFRAHEAGEVPGHPRPVA